MPQFGDLKFPTPSGKIEIASDPPPRTATRACRTFRPIRARRAGCSACSSPASAWLMNSIYNNDPKVAEKLGPETVTLQSRRTPRASACKDGDTAIASNERPAASNCALGIGRCR